MTNNEKQALREMTAEPAAADFLEYFQNEIMKGNVHPDKLRDEISEKAEYWFMAGVNKGYIIATDQVAEMARKTLDAG